jgi:hypothetical protein
MMNSFDGEHVSVSPGSTSYFSSPSTGLDPKLFEGDHLRSWVRNNVLRILFDHLAVLYQDPNRWVSAWLAGSGVSYQWESAREPGDLDCLVGIDYVQFRQINSDYSGMSNTEISAMFNEEFANDLMPQTSNWEGYELTYYVNPQSNIVDINPYAAYDLINDSWTVEPNKTQNPPYSRMWEQRANKDYEDGVALVKRYGQALTEFRNASENPAARVNAERKLKMAIEQASTLYEDIHHGRKVAFSLTGSGYADYSNYRWQAGKQSGIIQALKLIKDYKDAAKKSEEMETYGVELPTPEVLIRRTLSRKNPRQ